MNERIGFGLRLLAALIDGVVIVVLGSIVGSVLGGVLGAGTGAAIASGAAPDDAAKAAALGGIFAAVAGAALGIAVLGVVWLIWEGLTGQALGKMLLKIRIKSEDGTNAGVDKLLTRAAIKHSNELLGLIGALTHISIFNNLASLAGLVIFIGCFFVLGQSRQALHDKLAKTAVYKA